MDDVIVQRLQEAGVRPVDLARAIGITPPAASMILRRQRGIPPWHYEKIAALLNLSVSELFVRRDLIRHENRVTSNPSANDSNTGGAGADTIATSREHLIALFGELSKAVEALTTLEYAAIEWRERLAARAAACGIAVAQLGGQDAGTRAKKTRPPHHHRDPHRSPPRKRAS